MFKQPVPYSTRDIKSPSFRLVFLFGRGVVESFRMIRPCLLWIISMIPTIIRDIFKCLSEKQ